MNDKTGYIEDKGTMVKTGWVDSNAYGDGITSEVIDGL